jgi:hypothetical protein
MEKMIKFRMFHYYEEVATPVPEGQPKPLTEKRATFGQIVDIPREEDIARGERLGAFFTDEEREAIDDGSYTGPDYDMLRRTGQAAAAAAAEGQVVPTGGESLDMDEASPEEIADFIRDNRLNIPATVALAQNRADWAEKVLDAEGFVSTQPRVGVTEALEKIIANQTTGV